MEIDRKEAGLAARACLHEADMMLHRGHPGMAAELRRVGEKLKAFANGAKEAR